MSTEALDEQPPPSPAAAAAAAVRDELDQVVPHLVAALKRDDGVRELARRLDDAERRLASRQSRPIVARLHRLLALVRRLELDAEVREMLEGEIADIVAGAGYTATGRVGEGYDHVRHEVLEGTSAAGAALVVQEVYEPGLEVLGEVVIPARVRVGEVTTSDAAPDLKEQA